MLALEHLGGLKLAGCGPRSACAQLATGRWGNLVGWPVSFLGTAWFGALWCCYAANGRRRAAPDILRWTVRLGVAGSLFFMYVMIVERHLCPYCLAVHLGNLIFWLLNEGRRLLPVRLSFRIAAAGVATFAAVTAVLGLCEATVKQDVAGLAEREFQESLGLIVERVREQEARFAADAGNAAETASTAGCLAGRWRRGPEKAAIRLTLFGDHQCPHCRALEQQIAGVMDGRSDIALVFKHYPLCSDCNRQIKSAHLHEGACRAALAAEAAGLVGGNDAWWRMHDWLLANGAQVSEPMLRAAPRQVGVGDPEAIIAAMAAPAVLKAVEDDVETAAMLGVDTTPTLFINGVELAQPEVKDGVARAIAAVSQEGPPALTYAADRPRPCHERLFDLWRRGRPFDFSKHVARWTVGPADAPVRLVLGVCYANEYSPRFSQTALQWAAQRKDVRVELWHFPLTGAYNAAYARTRGVNYPTAYARALVAEAAGCLGGNEGFWRMHRWLLEHQADYSEKAIHEAADSLGLKADRLFAAIDTDEVRDAVDRDITLGGTVGFQGAPSIFLGGRQVPGPEPTPALLDRIVAEIDRGLGR